MNLREALLLEHSKAQADKIIAYIGDDATKFAAIMDLFLHDDYRVVQRASWVVNHCAINYPALIAPYWAEIFENVQKSGIHDAVKRNTVRLLQFITIPEEYHGIAIEICFQYLQSQSEPIAVKAFAMTVIHNHLPLYPELKTEFRACVEHQLPYQSPGFKNRAKKLLAKL